VTDGIIKVIKKPNVIFRLSGILKIVGAIVVMLLSDDEFMYISLMRNLRQNIKVYETCSLLY